MSETTKNWWMFRVKVLAYQHNELENHHAMKMGKST
jgi:hypothetical protein